MKVLPKISMRQHYIFAPLFQLFNEGGLDLVKPSKNKWFGIKRKLYNLTFKWHCNEARRLRKKHGNTTYRSR